MSDQDLLEPRPGPLPQMLKAVVHSGSNWHTRFLPKISSEEIRAVSFAKRRQDVFISESFTFSFFLLFFFWTHTQPSKQCWMCDFDGHIYWKKVKEAENLLTCHLRCAFKAVNSICSIFPKRASWKQLFSISFVFAICQSFLFKITLNLIFYFLSFIQTC